MTAEIMLRPSTGREGGWSLKATKKKTDRPRVEPRGSGRRRGRVIVFPVVGFWRPHANFALRLHVLLLGSLRFALWSHRSRHIPYPATDWLFREEISLDLQTFIKIFVWPPRVWKILFCPSNFQIHVISPLPYDFRLIFILKKNKARRWNKIIFLKLK